MQGYLATQSGTGTKTDTPLSQTAQSISVVSAEQVRDQGVSSVQETLRYVPGVFAEPGGVDSRNDYFKNSRPGPERLSRRHTGQQSQ